MLTLFASLANYPTLLSYYRSARTLLYATWMGPNAHFVCLARKLLYANFMLSQRSRATIRYFGGAKCSHCLLRSQTTLRYLDGGKRPPCLPRSQTTPRYFHTAAALANYSTLLGWGRGPTLLASLANYSTLVSCCRGARTLLYATWMGPNARIV